MAKTLTHWLQTHILGAARVHFALAAVYLLSIIIFDAWNLITPDAIIQRWMLGAVLLVVTALVWYGVRLSGKSNLYYQSLALALILVDLVLPTYSVYNQRRIASKAVLLYVIPIIVSAILLSRAAIFATATVSVALYTAACVRYFYSNPGQAYKVELYGEAAFYSALLFVIAALLWSLIATNKQK